MSFLYLEKLNNVGEYAISNNDFYFVQNRNVIKYPNKKILSLNDFWGVKFTEKLFNVFTNRSFNTFFNYNGELINSFDQRNFYYIFSENNFIFFDRNEKVTKFNDKIISFDKIGGSFIHFDFLFIPKTNFIICINFKTAQALWQFDLAQLGTYQDSNGETQAYEVKKIIGVCENELFVACNNHTLLSIDIETGKLLYKWQDFNGYELYPGKELLPEPSTFVLDAENKQMISLYGSYYIEIELKKRQIQITEVKDSFEKYNIISFRKSSDYSFDKTHIYTIAEMDISKLGLDWIQRCIIAVNRETKEIDWQYVFEDVPINTDIPQLADNKLYQLDGNQTLHIFQKE